jgi:ribosome-associated translation inhibitor RaiA
MQLVATENFTLTPAVRKYVENNLSKLKVLLPGSASLTVTLGASGHQTFTVVCKARLWGNELVLREEGTDFYQTIRCARLNLTRQILDIQYRLVQLESKCPHFDLLSVSNGFTYVPVFA